MPGIYDYVGSKAIPPKVGEHKEETWLVWHNGNVTPYSSEAVATASADYYKRQGESDVRVEHKIARINDFEIW